MKKEIIITTMCCIALSGAANAQMPSNVVVTGYNRDVNYMELMISAANDGSDHAMAMGSIYEAQRNMKLLDTTGESGTSFFENEDATYVKNAINAYLAPKCSYSDEDVYLVAKIMTAEAGSDWLSDEWKMSVGNVLLNRVESPEFPNTVAECIYQQGQYYSRGSRYFANLVPSQRCVDLAYRLCSGERVLPANVVFQANFSQGGGCYKKFHDDLLGNTYFCYSNHPELY